MNRKHQEEWQSTPGKKTHKGFPQGNFRCKEEMIVEDEQKPDEVSNKTSNRPVSHEGPYTLIWD
jgi:hypothetical protein